MKVLIVKTSSMGDIIHTLPALTDAMRAIEGIRFDWVVEEGFKEIPAWHSAVDQVIPVAIRRWRKSPIQAWRSGQWQAFKQQLAATQYDASNRCTRPFEKRLLGGEECRWSKLRV